MATALNLKNFASWDLSKSKYEEIDELPLMQSPGPVLMILAIYLLFVLKLGPAFMRKRPAYKLTRTLLAYNFIQVAISVYLVQKYFRAMLELGLVPRKCHMTNERLRQEIVFGIWLYFAAKVTELLDTVFFVLRKKDNQITFLHLYHHSIMMVGTWAFFKYSPSDTALFIGFLNSLVHVFMYTYYGLAALGPKVAKYLTWKKYMTTFQLVQFVSIVAQYLITVKLSECPPSKGVAIFIVCNTLVFLVLFVNFYKQSYVKKNNKTRVNVSNPLGICMIQEKDVKVQ
ncbi:elongation of very long chain fatty acids protein-like [Leguminivora glycinivorella]|uniref:elongation of very long chain fatty acids protein-like n=1 Tax=Leguminivora glycinivorella TaxID=1035111 RepID=UPI00200E43FB|nr:elongation of very long chain fatty acids protein-like [Leguminivora glycinivorella]